MPKSCRIEDYKTANPNTFFLHRVQGEGFERIVRGQRSIYVSVLARSFSVNSPRLDQISFSVRNFWRVLVFLLSLPTVWIHFHVSDFSSSVTGHLCKNHSVRKRDNFRQNIASTLIFQTEGLRGAPIQGVPQNMCSTLHPVPAGKLFYI